MQELLTMLLQSVLAVVVPVLAAYAVKLINSQAQHAAEAAKSTTKNRIIEEANRAVSTAVALIAQTYTDELKAEGAFTLANQKEALRRAVDAAKSQLCKDSTRLLTDSYGDLNRFLVDKIEAEVQAMK
jgi:ABC-type transporter MlaC component